MMRASVGCPASAAARAVSPNARACWAGSVNNAAIVRPTPGSPATAAASVMASSTHARRSGSSTFMPMFLAMVSKGAAGCPAAADSRAIAP